MLNENGQSITDSNNILDKEIESWKSFEYALRKENAILFNKMLEESREYSESVTAKGEPLSAESLLMALIFHQQKMIKTLIERLSKVNKVGPKPRPIYLSEYDER